MDIGKDIRGHNFFDLDVNLQRSLERVSPGILDAWGGRLRDFGAWVGSAVDEEAEYTDRFGRPVLQTYDRDGETVNRVVKNPAWEKIHREVFEHGIVGLNYTDTPAPFLVTFAMNCLLSQADLSMSCPVTMTHSVAYVLNAFAPDAVRDKYLPQLVATDGSAKSGGTWATELHGGSDVGATTTVAERDGAGFRLTGLKWFASNPDGGIALATARPDPKLGGSRGLGLYVVPAHLEDGSVNAYRIRRLKEKLGTRGVATAEIDLLGAWAEEVAPPPKGLPIMMEALGNSRIHLVMGASGIQWRAFLEALAFASRRRAFGKVITEFPMVQDELLKMLVGVEASYALAFESCRMFDRMLDDEGARPWMRLSTALAKYLTCEISITNCRAALEVIGGNGYTDDFITPRLLRDAQVNSIWEGPANIQALEVVRMLGNRHPGFEAFGERVNGVLGAVPRDLERLAETLRRAFGDCLEAVDYVRSDPELAERHARKLMHLLSQTLAGVLLLEQAAEDWQENDGRKALVARMFIEGCFDPPPRNGVGPGQDWAQDHFDALVHFAKVDAAAL